MPDEAQRKLAAIVSADVAGYSRLIGTDEARTLADLRALRRELIDPKVAEHGGRIVKTMGDGLLLEFSSVVRATQCVIEVQLGMAERNRNVPEERRIEFRIGVHLGDIAVEDDDIFGDGVNVAARLESLCEPGGIILSGTAYENNIGRIDATFTDAGSRQLKNISHPVQTWRWQPAPDRTAPDAHIGAPLSLPDKPSIAVLPLDNMSDDPEQEYLADGIAEDVITALSRYGSLFVIARNSTFTYKGQAVDVTQVARDLGVRYVVEGSVRKSGERLRISAQLIDALTGHHIWAERFDRELADIFDLQDQITEQIVVAVEPEIASQERERAQRKPPESLEAWGLMQRGLSHFLRFNKDDRAEAVRLLEKATELDPRFAAAHAHLGWAHYSSLIAGFANDGTQAREAARRSAEQAVSLDPNEPLGHLVLGRLHVFSGSIDMAIDEMRQVIAANPNFARGHYGLAWAYLYGAGEPDKALPHFDMALRLSPRDPNRWLTLMLKAAALRLLERHGEALSHCRQACQIPHTGFLPYMHLASILSEIGEAEDARAAIEKATEIEPRFSIGFLRANFQGLNERAISSLFDGLRSAGAPE